MKLTVDNDKVWLVKLEFRIVLFQHLFLIYTSWKHQ